MVGDLVDLVAGEEGGKDRVPGGEGDERLRRQRPPHRQPRLGPRQLVHRFGCDFTGSTLATKR